ncbi:MAG: hypothetical protein IPN71_12620 [Fibrobacteres bacterium]|nr:hypothetical protein [Fibrobacterota bacterium]
MTFPLILRKPRVLFGAVAAFLVGMVLAWFALTEIVYHVAVADIVPRIAPPPQRILPLKIRQVGWVSIGETGPMRMRSAYLGWFPMAILGSFYFDKHPGKSWFGAGYRAADFGERNHFTGIKGLEDRLLAILWITRHWTVDQAISANFDRSLYGRDLFQPDSASRLYFGRPLDSLDLPQAVALIALTRSSHFVFRGDSARFTRSFASLQDRVIENFPELATEKGPMPRFLVNACPARSDSL